MKDFIGGFERYLIAEKSVSSNTLQAYIRDINQFKIILDEYQITMLDVSNSVMQKIVSRLKEYGRSNSTITRFLASIRCFYKYLNSINVTSINPAQGINLEKKEKKLPQILSSHEIELLLAQPNCLEPKGCRDKAMLEVLYATGIRVSELVDLDVDDVNLSAGILICKGNGNKGERIIPIHMTAVTAISDYLNRVRNVMLTIDHERALFVNLNGKRLTRQGCWKILKSYTKMARINKDITPHTLRHSFATHLLQNGAQLTDIKEMLGHADISSTQIYVDIVQKRFKEVYKNCHPRARVK